MMKFSRRFKFNLGFFAAFCLLAVITSVSYFGVMRLIENARWISHTYKVLETAAKMSSALKSKDSAARGFVIDNNENFAKDFSEAHKEILLLLSELERLTADNTSQQGLLREFEEIYKRKSEINESLMQARRTSFQASLKIWSSFKLHDMIAELQNQLTAIQNEEETLLKIRLEEGIEVRRTTLIISTACGVMMLLMILTTGFFTNATEKKLAISLLHLEKEGRIKNSLNELWERLIGGQSSEVLAEKTVFHLTQNTDTQLGFIYAVDQNEKLKLKSSFGAQKSEDKLDSFSIGESLVGQAVKNKHNYFLENVPKDYFKIHSGAGSLTPKHISIFPFFYEGEVTGAVELASFQPLTESAQELIKRSLSSIAIAFHSAQTHEKLTELLRVTELQSEELQTQQEELRQTNEELEEQSKVLKQSHEELQSQQEELRQANEELEEHSKLLVQKNREIQTKKESLEKLQKMAEEKAKAAEVANQYKSTFLANMSHELRTPLNSILLLSYLIAENRTRNLTDKQVELANTIHSAGNDLLNLINDILDLSKVEAGKVELRIEPTDLNDILTSLKKIFIPLAENKKILFEIKQAPNLPTVIQSDRQKLEQVLKNILSNAFKFTSQGRVSIDITKSRTETITIAISDTGCGIPKNKQGLVFEAFQQADASLSRKYGGTGLGLSISREFARLLGGEITLQSEEGSGSTFILEFPISQDVSRTQSEDLPKITPLPKKLPSQQTVKRLLLIDQNPFPLKACLSQLESEQLSITQIEPDQPILPTLNAHSFDCIVLNMGSQEEILGKLEQIRKHANHATSPLILYTEHELSTKLSNLFSEYSNSVIVRGQKSEERLMAEVCLFLKEAFPKAPIPFYTKERNMFATEKKILLVDDDLRNIYALSSVLADMGLLVTTATNGRESLNKLKDEPGIDLVLMDIMMPEMDGYEAIREIRKQKQFETIPIIALTAKAMKGDRDKCLAAGASDYLSKPVDPEKLSSLLQVWLGEHENQSTRHQKAA